MSRPKPVVLAILDGFGIAPASDGNAITKARMPIFKRLIENYPAMTIQGSGGAVGLSWGEMGNSEVGHLTIGAGRVFYQTLPRINLAIETGDFFQNPALQKAIAHAKQFGSKLHFMGLVSSGNVHATQEHLHALLDVCQKESFDRVFIHAFLDGRDALYNSAEGFIEELQKKCAEVGRGTIATMSGRFYAMDRDNRWDRIQLAYEAMTRGTGATAEQPATALRESYAKNIFDEQFLPTVMMRDGKPVACIESNDAVVYFNYRADRARELTKAFVLPGFEKFPRTYLHNVCFVTMAEYEKGLPVEVAFPPQMIDSCLARVVSDAGLRQLHIAETEKYAHVTFFLNGMREEAFPGEDRVIIPSPQVSSYDQAPAMSAEQIGDRVEKEIEAGTYDFIVLNLANPDMVGHTGNLEATIKSCEITDKVIGQIVHATLAVNGAVVITADHGNAEEVKNLVTGEIDKEHSTNPVPLLIVQKDREGIRAPSGDVIGGDLSLVPPVGMLADVAPTVCTLLEIPPSPDMTGQSLI